jgi:hypothetical protein
LIEAQAAYSSTWIEASSRPQLAIQIQTTHIHGVRVPRVRQAGRRRALAGLLLRVMPLQH